MSYELRVPRHVVRDYEASVEWRPHCVKPDGQLADDILAKLKALEDDPTVGMPTPDGNRVHSFKVLRAPLTVELSVSYAVLEEQQLILVNRLR